MFNNHYYRAGDVSHHTKVEAAPPGESIRFADDIRKELLARAEEAFKSRVAFEFESPDLGKIKLVVAERLDYMDMNRTVYFKLNDAVHTLTFDPYQYHTRQDLIQAFFKALSESIAQKLLLALPPNVAKLFGDSP